MHPVDALLDGSDQNWVEDNYIYENRVLYAYGVDYPLATFTQDEDGRTILLINTSRRTKDITPMTFRVQIGAQRRGIPFEYTDVKGILDLVASTPAQSPIEKLNNEKAALIAERDKLNQAIDLLVAEKEAAEKALQASKLDLDLLKEERDRLKLELEVLKKVETETPNDPTTGGETTKG